MPQQGHPPNNTSSKENVMQPYEIRQLRDGSLDYNSYYARPISLLTPNMQRFCKQAASLKTALVVAIAVGAILLIAASSTHRTVGANCAPTRSAGDVCAPQHSK